MIVSSPAPTVSSGWVLALDASTPQSVVVVGQAQHPTTSAEDEEVARGAQASEGLVRRLESALTEAGVSARDLAAVAVGRGPGTFTGARVGVATAKGLAIGLGLPLHPVSTLEAVAHDVPDSATRVLATLDARKGEVYGALFERRDGDLRLVGEESVDTLASLLDRHLDHELWVAGTGLRTDETALAAVSEDRRHATDGVTARGLWSATRAALARPPANAATLDIVYLRKSYAELGIHKPKRPFKPSPFV